MAYSSSSLAKSDQEQTEREVSNNDSNIVNDSHPVVSPSADLVMSGQYADGTQSESPGQHIKEGSEDPNTRNSSVKNKNSYLPSTDLHKIRQGNPFYSEVDKIISGNLQETDSTSRQRIIDYCEHLRSAYTTRDIDFIRQVFSEDALIIVGNVVKSGKRKMPGGVSQKVIYSVEGKQEYLRRLDKVFKTNKKIEIRFSDFEINRHPTKEGIYGVKLKQGYRSDRYGDEGWLFLLWDFRNPSMPQIYVRTWQAAKDLQSSSETIDLSDFNLE